MKNQIHACPQKPRSKKSHRYQCNIYSWSNTKHNIWWETHGVKPLGCWSVGLFETPTPCSAIQMNQWEENLFFTSLIYACFSDLIRFKHRTHLKFKSLVNRAWPKYLGIDLHGMIRIFFISIIQRCLLRWLEWTGRAIQWRGWISTAQIYGGT